MKKKKKLLIPIFAILAVVFLFFILSGEDEGEGYFVGEDGLSRGFGLEIGEATSELDANPDRAVRRSLTPIKQSVGRMYNGKALDSKVYFYRNELSSDGQKVYDLLRNGFLSTKSKIQITVPISSNDIWTVYQAVVYDSPELFWVDTSMSYSYNNYGNVTEVRPQYNDLANDIPGNTAKIEAAVNEALGDMWSLQSDVEKAKYAHDYLTYTNTYVTGAPHNQNIFSSLVNGKTVCAGYAHAFQYMMQKMGIPCAYVIGYAGENHAWNLVYLDGAYYAMDVTWDDPLNNPPNTYYYNYFNITDDQLARDHSRNAPSTSLPWAQGTAASFANYFGGNAYGTDFDAIVGTYPSPDSSVKPSDTENPYLPSDNTKPTQPSVTDPKPSSGDGGNSYLPNDYDYELPNDQAWYDDYEDYDYTDYSEWWCMLDSDWKKSDWKIEDMFGFWEIWDEDSKSYYLYDEDGQGFYCMDMDSFTVYKLDPTTGEWNPF